MGKSQYDSDLGRLERKIYSGNETKETSQMSCTIADTCEERMMKKMSLVHLEENPTHAGTEHPVHVQGSGPGFEPCSTVVKDRDGTTQPTWCPILSTGALSRMTSSLPHHCINKATQATSSVSVRRLVKNCFEIGNWDVAIINYYHSYVILI